MNVILDHLSRVGLPDVSDVDTYGLKEPNPGVTLRGQHPVEMQCTRAMIKAMKPRRVLEVGIEHGWTTTAILGFPSSIEYYMGCDPVAETFVTDTRLPLFQFYCGLYTNFIDGFLAGGYEKFDMVHFDGDHYNVAHLTRQMATLPQMCNSGAVVIIHDMEDPHGVERKIVEQHLHLFDAHVFTLLAEIEKEIDLYPNLFLLKSGINGKQAQFIGILK
jgi:hypothetical protein